MSDDHKKHYDGAPSEGPMNIDVSMVRELAEMLDDTGLTDIEVRTARVVSAYRARCTPRP